jgi:hypothetical protein
MMQFHMSVWTGAGLYMEREEEYDVSPYVRRDMCMSLLKVREVQGFSREYGGSSAEIYA